MLHRLLLTVFLVRYSLRHQNGSAVTWDVGLKMVGNQVFPSVGATGDSVLTAESAPASPSESITEGALGEGISGGSIESTVASTAETTNNDNTNDDSNFADRLDVALDVATHVDPQPDVVAEAIVHRRRRLRRRRLNSEQEKQELSRREWLRLGTVMVSTCLIGGAVVKKNLPTTTEAFNKALGPVDLSRIWQETAINITVQGPPFTWVALDSMTLEKKQTLKLPGWVPPSLIPPARVIRGTSNVELLMAAALAGSVVEMARTSILYPLLTLKVRIQSEVNTRRKTFKGKTRHLRLGTRFELSMRTAKKHWEEGNLYAGLLPSLLIAAPATGLFYGVRDVAKRALVLMFPDGILGTDIPIMLTAAFLGDAAALAFRTPFDTLSIRLQAATATNSAEALDANHQQVNETITGDDEDDDEALQLKVGNWLTESVERLPAVLATDLPYLLSRIVLNRLILIHQVNVGRYEIVVVGVAILCALLTTPFDVARTRILVDSSSSSTGIDGGSGEGLLRTFRTIYNEGDGGIRNLFAGWMERTAYLGVLAEHA
ncbi:hypothetical protein ACA910_011331 [Epithemia clementina (nom. ined.)]